MHLSVRFSNEAGMKSFLDFLYEKSQAGVSFTGLLEAMENEVTVVTAIHNIKSNKGSHTAGVDKIRIDRYLQMPKQELITLIQSSFNHYKPKPAQGCIFRKATGKIDPWESQQCLTESFRNA